MKLPKHGNTVVKRCEFVRVLIEKWASNRQIGSKALTNSAVLIIASQLFRTGPEVVPRDRGVRDLPVLTECAQK
jgi:hypothetical protein